MAGQLVMLYAVDGILIVIYFNYLSEVCLYKDACRLNAKLV